MSRVVYGAVLWVLLVINGYGQRTITVTAIDTVSDLQVLSYDLYDYDAQIILPSNEAGEVRIQLEASQTKSLTLFSENYEITTFNLGESSGNSVVVHTSRLSIELSAIEIAARRDELFSLKQLKDVEGTSIFAGKKTEVILLDKFKGNLATNNAREIYAQIAGLNIYEGDNGGIQLGIGGRGLDPNRTANFNTRQNGYDISADVLGYPESYYTPPSESIEEIQVVRGASSLQYGTQFGGLINFKLRDIAGQEGLSINTRQTVGSFGLLNSYNQIGYKAEALTVNVGVNYKTGDGYRDNSEFESINLFTTVGYEFSKKTTLTGELTYFNYLSQQAGGLTDDQFLEDPRQSTRERNWFGVDYLLYNLRLSHKIDPSATLSLSLFGLRAARSAVGFRGNPINLNENPITGLDEQDADGNFISPRDLIIDDFNNWGLEAKYLKRYQLLNKNAVFLLGAKVYQSNNTSLQGPGTTGVNADFGLATDQFPDYPNQSNFDLPNRNYALFAEHIIYLDKDVSIIPGVRIEHINTATAGTFNQVVFDNAGNPLLNQELEDNRTLRRTFALFGIGLNYKKLKNTTLYANISQNYRSVTFSDIRVVNPTFIVDPDLRDERGFTADIGLRGRLAKSISFDLGAYTIQYQDRIGVILDDRANRLRTNIGNASIIGVESFADINITNLLSDRPKGYSLKWFVNAAFTYSRYTSSDENNVIGKRVEFVPQVNLKTGVSYKIGQFSTSLQYTYLSEQFTDAQNSESVFGGDSRSGIIGTIPAYSIIDFNITQSFGAIEISAGLNNLLDEDYFTRRATGYPGPGIIPSDGRSFYVTVGYEFR
jgi:Fe(3+) dicitrate transport protein